MPSITILHHQQQQQQHCAARLRVHPPPPLVRLQRSRCAPASQRHHHFKNARPMHFFGVLCTFSLAPPVRSPPASAPPCLPSLAPSAARHRSTPSSPKPLAAFSKRHTPHFFHSISILAQTSNVLLPCSSPSSGPHPQVHRGTQQVPRDWRAHGRRRPHRPRF